MERTMVFVKPDGVMRGLTGEIIARIERSTLKLIGLKMLVASKEFAGKHYADDEGWYRSVGEKALAAAEKRGEKLNMKPIEIGKLVRSRLMDFISMGPVVAMVFEGNNAVAKVRAIVGATSPEHAAPGTVRGDFSTDSFSYADSSGRPIQNLVHASGDVEESKREIRLWFKESELHSYRRTDEPLVNRKG